MISRRAFLYASGGTIAAAASPDPRLLAGTPDEPDHIILGCRDLDEGIAYTEKRLGYHAALGGSHPGRGTRNALLKMGARSYIEILAPDPAEPQLTWHQAIVTLEEPLLIGW